jgi:23S rRNA (guanosine2251-2'-O)-methyltransferase
MGEYLYRRNTVLEALRGSRRELIRLWIQQGAGQTEAIVTAARERGLPIEETSKQHLGQLAGSGSHQGVVLESGPYVYGTLDEMLALADRRGERPFLLLLDLLHGPHNIGMLLRTAEACGVHGVVIQDRRAPEITPEVVIYSAGAAEHLPITQVTNLVQAMGQLKEQDVWLVGMDLSKEARGPDELDLDMALGVVVGHEGQGMRRLVRQNCDFLVRLPMRGQVESLNAATAGSILLYLAWQARGYQGANRQT